MAIMLNFHPQYKDLILKGQKTTTVRLGDRTDKYKVGENVILSIGEKWCLTKIGEGIIKEVYTKQMGELSKFDLAGESLDSNTPEGLRECMQMYYRHTIDNEDQVTIVRFNILVN